MFESQSQISSVFIIRNFIVFVSVNTFNHYLFGVKNQTGKDLEYVQNGIVKNPRNSSLEIFI